MITVIADDLTGAAEIAGICLRYGLDVSFGIDTISEKEATINIIATDTRSMTEDEAYEIHFHLSEEIISKTKNIIFKKCDSVLRGHVLTELSALLDATENDCVLLQPSNPNGNRCIKNASYLISDILIENTGFGIDPDFPAKTSSVKTLLLDRSSKKDSIAIYTGMINKINSKGFYIPDCNSEDDLFSNLRLYNEDMIIGGSGAFFEQFLIKLKVATKKKKVLKFNFSKDYLLVSGSTHPKSIAFSKMLQNKNCPMLFFSQKLLQKDMEKSQLIHWVEEVLKIVAENKKAVLRVSNLIIHFENSSKILKKRMSFIINRLLRDSHVNEVFIEGGATAYDIFKELHWKSFTPIAELALGVVRMQYDNDSKKFITIKPGSYEWPEGLLN